MAGEGTPGFTTVIVNYIPDAVNEGQLGQMFAPWKPEHVKLVHNKVTGASCGYGFIEFVHREDALRCIDAMNGKEVYGKRLKVTLAKPREEVRFNTNCYVAGIPNSWTEELFRQLVSHFGDIMEYRLMPAQAGHSTLSGFVRFARRLESDNAIAVLDGFGVSREGILVKPDSNDPSLPALKARLASTPGIFLLSAKYAADARTRAKEHQGVWMHPIGGMAPMPSHAAPYAPMSYSQPPGRMMEAPRYDYPGPPTGPGYGSARPLHYMHTPPVYAPSPSGMHYSEVPHYPDGPHYSDGPRYGGRHMDMAPYGMPPMRGGYPDMHLYESRPMYYGHESGLPSYPHPPPSHRAPAMYAMDPVDRLALGAAGLSISPRDELETDRRYVPSRAVSLPIAAPPPTTSASAPYSSIDAYIGLNTIGAPLSARTPPIAFGAHDGAPCSARTVEDTARSSVHTSRTSISFASGSDEAKHEGSSRFAFATSTGGGHLQITPRLAPSAVATTSAMLTSGSTYPSPSCTVSEDAVAQALALQLDPLMSLTGHPAF